MTELSAASLPYSGEQLWNLTEQLRLGMFKATLFLACLLVLPAVPMVLLVDEELGLRLGLLAAVGTLCGLGAAEAGWCYRRLREQQWLILLPAALAASVLIVGGGRQNPTFFVIGTAFVGAPAIVEVVSAMTAGSVIVAGYAISILVRRQGLLVDGSAGDLAAMISLLVAIYAAYRVAELVTRVVADVNLDATEATAQVSDGASALGKERFIAGDTTTEVPARVVAQEATDQVADDALGRLSGYGLTPAELGVAYLAGEGRSPKRIAEKLEKSPKTVSNQLRTIKEKLEVETRAELTAQLRRLLVLPASGDAGLDSEAVDGEGRPPGEA